MTATSYASWPPTTPGFIAEHARIYRPQVGVVTVVGLDHYKSFRGRAGVAAEKGDLISALPADGVAVLNLDDPYVSAMANLTRARVLTYGLSEGADVRGHQATARWPGRLSLEVTYGDQRVKVQTQLVGEHWATSVLAALAAGIACGAPLEDAATALATVPPFDGRMSVHEVPGSVVFIRDDWKATYWAMPLALDFLATARAKRRIFIMGSISDAPGSSSPKYRKLARQALESAELVFFVGPRAQNLKRGLSEEAAARLHEFPTVQELNSHLAQILKPGDLVYVKGSGPSEHLERLTLARLQEVACWRERCGRWTRCEDCALFGTG